MAAKRWPRVRRAARWLGIALVVVLIGMTIDAWTAMGHRAVGARRARMERSPQWHDGSFENPQPLQNDSWLMVKGLFGASSHTSPEGPVPTVTIHRAQAGARPATGLRVTWLGHATQLLEIDGARVLTDPVWSERASPFGWVGPRRWYAPPLPLAALPPIDAVVVSHDHYDHLDYPTVHALRHRAGKFVVPLGIGAHLEYWGIPKSKVVELDWWERTRVKDLEIVCTPARHASGRSLFDQNATLWSSWAFLGHEHRAWFSGDTGLFPGLRDIGERLGPFDVTMIEAGQYDRAWPDWHIGPEQAIAAHHMVRGRVFVPIHWGLFALAYHGWTEPAERVLAAADHDDVPIVVPRPGQSVEPGAPPARQKWWPRLPWQTAAQHPIRSTRMQ